MTNLTTATATPLAEIDRIYTGQRVPENLQRLKESTAKERLTRIQKIEQFLLNEQNLTACADALWNDLRKSREETMATELATVFTTISHVNGRLKRWMMDEPVGTTLALTGTSSYIRNDPKGQVLVIAPWNYPLQLLLNPLIYALAAGNAVMAKPSEMAPATSAFIAQMVADIFPENEVAVIEGGIAVSTALLQKQFDHIFFTGSPHIGKIVMKAAAEHLSSVTLELGGKSPVFIDEQMDMKSAAEKIAWGKCINSGQTCIAPDYVLLPENRVDSFIHAFSDTLSQFYGPGDTAATESDTYPKMIHSEAVVRMESLIQDAVGKGAKVALGGNIDEKNQKVAPTLITGVSGDMKLMQEEIFGPVLPIVTYSNWKDVPEMINRLGSPLALYIMSNNARQTEFMINNTRSGGVGINDLLITVINPNLPFGGVNHSGIGKTNGRFGFLAFTNQRGIIKRNWMSFKMVYPPYNAVVFKWLLRLSRW